MDADAPALHPRLVDIDTLTLDPKNARLHGWGTALKPAFEPACIARKPLSEPTVAANVLKWGTGGINIDAGRHAFGDPAWPGPTSNEHLRGQICNKTADRSHSPTVHLPSQVMPFFDERGRWPANIYATPKPSTSEREAGTDGEGSHPTVKPRKLMAQLLKLFCPPGRTVLDPFGGSGTTLVAAAGLDCKVIVAEREPGYCDIIRARGEWSLTQAEEKPRAPGKPRTKARDGDKRQARRRVQALIQNGTLPKPADVTCVDCKAAPGREYDHHLGYDAAHHEDVEALCATCHHAREAERANAKTPAKTGVE